MNMNIISFLAENSFFIFCICTGISIVIYLFLRFNRTPEIFAWLKNKHFSGNNSQKNNSSPYQNLAPVDCYEKIKPYEEMLLSALRDCNVKNIAIAGAYGSGKSSIIKTFLKNYPCYSKKLVNVSLASFCIESETGVTKNMNQDSSDILQRQLELSILQQLIYHIPPDEIPYSRFRRIWNISKHTIVSNTLATIIVLLELLSFVKPDFYCTLVPNDNSLWTKCILLGISLMLCIIFINWIVKFCSRLSWFKINIPNVELELSKTDASSILNRHMDEIIYYFEAGSFNIVIFEDLDRFDSILIFQKLREINLILNNARQVGRRIIFIYALRDDVFKDENRTKFFDYMIPVVPIVNISNSGDKLIEFFELHKEISPAPSNDFLSEISIFIDSMRLLVGICNEYVLYHKILSDGKLVPEKLFGMIVYKNLYPKDFVSLHNNKGVLASIFQDKTKHIKEKDATIYKEIAELNDRLKAVEQTWLKDKNELRMLYLSFIACQYPDYAIEITVKDRYTLWQYLNEDLWQQLYLANRINIYAYSRNLGSQNNAISFPEIESKYGKYSEREKIIERVYGQSKKEIELRIDELKKQRMALKTITIAELISNQTLSLAMENAKEKSLIGFLVGRGYIDENYHTYISFFHEGSLTQADNEFVMSVIGMNQPSWDRPLTNTKNIINRLHIQYFDKLCILNFDLLTQLLITTNSEWTEKRNTIGSLIAKLDAETKRFIDVYLDQPDSKPETLFEIIAQKRDDFWQIIETQTGLPSSRKDKYLAILLDGCSEQLQQLNKSDSLKTYLAQMDHIFGFIDEYENPDACINAIKKLKIQFANLNFPKSTNALLVFDYIYTSNAYILNINALNVVLATKLGQTFDETSFRCANYSYIKKSNLSNLIDYVDQNWTEYYNNVILGNFKQKDDQAIIMMVLNNPNIDIEIKISYLLCQEVPLVDLQLVSDNEVKNAIIKNDAMTKNWYNVFAYFVSHSMMLTSEMVAYLNRVDVYATLGKEKINYLAEIFTEKNAETIFSIITESELLSENTVLELLMAIPFKWKSFDIESLPKKRIQTLMTCKIFSLSTENYAALKSKFPNCHIKLIEQNSSYFLSIYSSLSIDNNDWTLILKSSIDNDIKKQIIEREYKKLILVSTNISAMLPIVENSYKKHWDIDIICACLPYMTNDIALKIGTHHLKTRVLKKAESAKIIGSLPELYCKLVQSKARPSLPKDHNTEFLINYIKDWDIISSIDDSDEKLVKITMKKFDEIS